MRKILIFLLLFISISDLYSQEPAPAPRIYDQTSFGVGGGLDYGGFGMNLLFYPVKSLGFFAGAGYAFAGVGFNAGLKARLLPKKPGANVDIFALAMGGYNAAIHVTNIPKFDKMFYGFTPGLGFDCRLRHNYKGYLTIALLFPVRSPDVDRYITDLQENNDVIFNNKLIPVAFSIGYRFIYN